jgi:tripartite-type tricarboxylate transporter receptor subunit TctC
MSIQRIGRILLTFIALLAAQSVPQSALAQGGAPTMRLVVGFPPGGSIDLVARQLAEKLRVHLGRPVIVDNRPGALSRIARSEVKRAPRDGNTLMFSTAGGSTVLPHLYSEKNLGYTPEEFTAVARVALFDYVLAAGPKVEARTLAELRAWIKRNPNATYGSPGTGSIPHLLGIELAEVFNAPMVHVPYKGLAPAVQDLAGGHISFVIASPVEVLDLHRAGKVRAVAAISDHRPLLLPDVPTLAEQGLKLSADSFFGVWAAAGTSPEIIARLNAAVVAVLRDADLQDRLAKMGLRTAPSTPAEQHASELEESKRWQAFIKRAGIVMEQ